MVIVGSDGPVISQSNKQTYLLYTSLKAKANYVETVDLPTPPLPDNTIYILLNKAKWFAILRFYSVGSAGCNPH